MFLDLLIRRNPEFLEATIALHQAGKLPANCFVLDLDAVERNARHFSVEAGKLGLKTFAMTKQVGRHSGFCQAAMSGGINAAVAVDIACAVACKRAGMDIGHLGHLVQVPRAEADLAAGHLQPDYWTVFNSAKASEAAVAAERTGRDQALLARIQKDGDIFYRGHEGGFDAETIVDVANQMDNLKGAHFAGITTFPALLFDQDTCKVKPTPNLTTLKRAADILEKSGRSHIEINAPGTTSSAVLSAIADAGATQCEPGNGLHGTTPLHAVEELPEDPAVCYLSEVSHEHSGHAYCFGGGLYIDPVFPDYEVNAIVSKDPANRPMASVEIPATSAIDYYGMIDTSGPVNPAPGDSVVFGFRGQAFVKRALVAGIRGIATGNPEVTTIENSYGQVETWPNLR